MKTTQTILTGLVASVLALQVCLAASEADIRELTVLYTNDEHGWMEGMEPGQGAANLYRLWREREGYREDGNFLILSGGDNWTGPAISTWTRGQSMVEVMNAMNYDAAAVGNHEFDFGLEILQQRISEADFPYLSANTVWRDSGRVATELGILPYTIKEVNDLRVGIIGLTTTGTARTTNPRYILDLLFQDYEAALRATVPLLEQSQPDLLFVIAHVCIGPLQFLANRVADLGIDLMGGGHCNELVASRLGDTVLLGGGFHFTAYARATLQFDLASGQVVSARFATHNNEGAEENPQVATIINGWRDRFQDQLGEVIAFSAAPIAARSQAYQQALLHSWLLFDPSADAAVSNRGGLRAGLPGGQITLNDVVSTLPFDNTLVAVSIDGASLLRALREGGRPIVGGLSRQGDRWILDKTGQAVRVEDRYRVLINSFMYDGGDEYRAFAEADPDGFDTGINYRQPLVDWLRNQETSRQNPLSEDRLLQINK